MTSAGSRDRNLTASEYLNSLHSLTSELETAMQAIARNALPELEQSVAAQQTLSERLCGLADDLCLPLGVEPSISNAPLDPDLARQLRTATDTLQTLNCKYAALLQHSSRSVALMASLFSSFQGHLQEASGPRLKHQTWSCQM
jgi:hypothetical protein